MVDMRGQAELFPQATKLELLLAKKDLTQYKKMKNIVSDFDRYGIELSEAQLQVYETCKKTISRIERAANLILDGEIREIIEFRYIKGNSRNNTINRFAGMTDRTIDRKISEGIESIANSIKLWEQ